MALITLELPSEKFQFLIRVLRFSATICGVDLLRKNYRLNYITYLILITAAIYFVLVFSEMYRSYQESNLIKLLMSSVTFGSATPGVVKFIVFLKSRVVINDLYNILTEIYREYENMGDKYRKALESSVDKSKRGLISLMIFYVIGHLGVVAVPYIWFFVTGERFLVLEFYLPGLDTRTDFGYFATLFLQSVMVIGLGFGLYGGDLVALIYLLHSCVFSYIYAVKIEYLNEMVENPDNNKKPCVTMALKDIAEWIQLYSK